MTADNEPMSEDIRQLIDIANDAIGLPEYYRMEATLIELERLRAKNAAMREIVQAVAEKGGEYWEAGDNVCLYCGARILAGVTGLEDDAVRHQPDCPVLKARALLDVEANNDK